MSKVEKNRLSALREDWMGETGFRHEYDALEEEFGLAESFIVARAQSGLTQAQLADRMGTKQSYVARLESGRIIPSVRTLQKFAKATGTKLKLQFIA